jgi:Domain of unknown function (DUF4352)
MTNDPASGPPPATSPSPPVRRRRRGCLVPLAIVLCVLVAIGIAIAIGGGDDDGDTETAQTTEDVHAVGETAHTADLDVTVLQAQDPFQPANELEGPQAGNRFVAVEAEMTNATDELITWSSAVGAELTDSENRPYTVALAGTDLPQLDGDVPAGGARRGWIVFEVPQDATGLQLRIKGSPTATGSLFDLGG